MFFKTNMKTYKRDSKGKFTTSGFIKWFVVVGIIFCSIGLYGAYRASPAVYKASGNVVKRVEAIAKTTFEEKVAKVKKEILTDLSLGCEVKGAKDPDGVIIFDSNNEASIGRFQFQRKTVIYYYKMFYSKDITAHEAIEIAIDPIRSEELAEKILFQDKGKGADNWFNCNNKMDIGARVNLLKKIME